MTNNCGCRYVTTLDSDGEYKSGNIYYCPVHAAAHDLLEACIYARDEMVVKTEGENGAYHCLEAAIAQAAPPDSDGLE